MKFCIPFITATLICFALPSNGQVKPSQRQASQKIGAPAPAVVGKQMVGTIDDLTFSSVAALKRFNSITDAQRKAVADEFQAAYQRATGENLEDPNVMLRYGLRLMKFLGKRRLHQNGTFQPEDASRYAARLGQLDKDTIGQMQRALEKIAGNPLELGSVVFAILSLDALFDGPVVTAATAQKMLSRLSSIETGAISRWRAALGTDNIDEPAAALSLLGAEGLFSGDRFQEDSFATALPVAQKLIMEGSGKQ